MVMELSTAWNFCGQAGGPLFDAEGKICGHAKPKPAFTFLEFDIDGESDYRSCKAQKSE